MDNGSVTLVYSETEGFLFSCMFTFLNTSLYFTYIRKHGLAYCDGKGPLLFKFLWDSGFKLMSLIGSSHQYPGHCNRKKASRNSEATEKMIILSITLIRIFQDLYEASSRDQSAFF